ncbi:prenyltransferase/squalene oxidase repeat-containing protein [Mariniblastus fucicola]|uniref:Squalene cyclase C-terminal domain-containing protein n=1 Tax=Mariniblastus fucicola TaxID=980251 RepID=A0A5B9PHA1_9BACT|nr:hypothetical protein [Mariniblastus fucicola]QEG24635.1 hypothetical protein MFFC18_45560 [Mariniblastus fucicola]
MTSAENASQENFEDEVVETGQRMLMFSVIPSWMISFIGHVALIVLLAFLVMPKKEEITTAIEASATPGETLETIDLDMADFDDATEEEFSEVEFDDVMPVEVESDLESLDSMESLESSEFVGAEEMLFDEGTFGEIGTSSGDGSEIGGRTGASKSSALKKYGGTDASEEAVELALQWIVKHQLPDGGWNLDHRMGPGDHRDSPNAGTLSEARNAATALALLPLLGSGNTHKVGKYKENVRGGLEYLMAAAKRDGRGISFMEKGGSTYSHGLCSIAICEAYGMTRDPRLAPFAQGVIWFSEDFQDRQSGGWRYVRAPTMSVASWQVMALKSAKLSGLSVNPQTWALLDKFLNSVSDVDGSAYRYRPANKNSRKGMTAIGLLCRMYTGRDKDHPGMRKGVESLSEEGPDLYEGGDDTSDIYYNYYATQVMKQYGGPMWDKWNDTLRDHLVETQSKEGNSAGSWYFEDPMGTSSPKGGRLYTTALACMTLEVYYRYLPIYGDESVSDSFRLD